MMREKYTKTGVSKRTGTFFCALAHDTGRIKKKTLGFPTSKGLVNSDLAPEL